MQLWSQSETVDHLLFRCPLWLEQRRNLQDRAQNLGSWSNERKDETLQNWRPSHKMVSATIKFTLKAQRLGDQKETKEERMAE